MPFIMFILACICLIPAVISFLNFKKGLDDAEKTKNQIESDPAYDLERRIRSRLNSNFYNSPDMETRKSKCADLIEDGAFMVGTFNILRQDITSSEGLRIYVHTSRGILGETYHQEFTRKPLMFNIARQSTQSTYLYTAPKKSVAGSAAMGALIGGAAGAVVGAAYANEKNANRTTIETSYGYFYCISLADPTRSTDPIDHIMISKKVSLAPPPRFIVCESEKYWIVNAPFCYDSSELGELLSYLNRILRQQYQSEPYTSSNKTL